MNKRKQIIILSIITMIMMIINIIIYINKIAAPTSNNNKIEKQYEEDLASLKSEQTDKERLNYLKGLTEQERIIDYIAKYIKAIEDKDYDLAYSLLYPDFKKNYFKTQDKFKEYCQNTYPQLISIEKKSFIREGIYYIIDISILDFVNLNNEAKNVKFVLIENNYDNFYLSFQVE